MKKLNLFKILFVLAVLLVGGITSNVMAATNLPQSVVSDGIREVEYIKNFPVIVKTADNGKYYIYCMDMSATYAGNVTFSKTGSVNPGYTYILTHLPNTGDKDKDFYITQMAVWYYEDYLNNNNFNLESPVKKYIIAHKDSEQVSKEIYKLYEGAKYYSDGYVKMDASKVTFTKEKDYYVSSEIKVYTNNLNGNVKYSLSNTPAGSLVVKSANGVKVKIPVNKIIAGKQLTFKLNAGAEYTKYTGYYYYNSPKYQRILFPNVESTTVAVSDSVTLRVVNPNFEVNISKTDVTMTKEVEGATLVVKDEKGNVIDKWVSTLADHKLKLSAGKYTLSETLAPKGYKLSTTTISFMLDEAGSLYVKNEKGVYVGVNKVIMINELIDVVSFAKKDSKTDKLLSGATLVVKDEKGNVVKEFTTEDSIYKLTLDAGKYTLSEVKAPNGYKLSKEVIDFELLKDGTLKVKNEKGVYVDVSMVTFYNTKEDINQIIKQVKVPATGASATLLMIGGAIILISGAWYARKTIKEC